MGNRADFQYVFPPNPCPPAAKKDDKPKPLTFGDVFNTFVGCLLLIFFGIPLFGLLLQLAFEFWFPHSYRYYP